MFEVLTVPAIIFGIIAFYNRESKSSEKIGKEIYIAFAISFVIGTVFAYLRSFTGLVNKAWYSITVLSFELPVMVLFILILIISFKKKNLINSKLFLVVSTLFLFLLNSYISPTVMMFLPDFPKGEVGVFSTAVLFKLLGFLIGLILLIVLMCGFYAVCIRHKEKSLKVKFILILLILLVTHAFGLIQPLFIRRIIPFSSTLFKIIMFVVNNSYMFIYLTLIVAITIPISVWYHSYYMNQPYSNPAEHRKIRAEARRRKRWSSVMIVIFLLSVVNLTAVKAYDEREIELSEVEEASIEGTDIFIPLEMVDDGNLHRFHHMAEDGKVEVRFIVIKKSANSYGIGLDACEI